MDGVHISKHSLARHEAAPLLRERESYLAYLRQLGVGRRRLAVVSAMLLQVIRHLGLTEPNLVTSEQVTAAGTAWCYATEHRRPPMAGPHSRRTFEGTARQFLRFTGMLLKPPPATNQFSGFLKLYLDETGRERRLSLTTRDTARSRLRRFFEWLASRRASLEDVKMEDIDAYLDLKRQSCNSRTISSEAAMLQDFFRDANRHGWCSNNFHQRVIRPRLSRPRYVGNRLRWDDVRKLLSSLKGNASCDLRARAMILLCALYGLRSSEVARLRLDSFDWEEGTFSLTRAKRGRGQCYPVLPELRDSVMEYLHRSRPQCDDRALFLSLAIPHRPVCPALVSYIVRSRISGLGLMASPAGAHALRHACATELLRTGSSLHEIADFLGHRNLRTVSCYVRHDEAALRRVSLFQMEVTVA